MKTRDEILAGLKRVPHEVMGESHDGMKLKLWKDVFVIASWGRGWDHVSVACPRRTPTWTLMALIKEAFFREDECAIQYHPAKDEYVNIHPHTLHLWRPQDVAIPKPPREMV